VACVALDCSFFRPQEQRSIISKYVSVCFILNMTANDQGLTPYRYSVLRKTGLMLRKDRKMKIYSMAWLYLPG
jgi:hypothetical protein